MSIIIYIIIFIIIIIIIYNFYKIYKKIYNDDFHYISVYGDKLDEYNNDLKNLELEMQQYYNLGDGREFKIEHGNKYANFFNRMGVPFYQLVYRKDKLIGTGCGILRNIKGEKVWYICDLKIKKENRKNWIPYRMLINSIYLKEITDKAYGISMNIPNKENPIVKLAEITNQLGLNFNYAGNILIYELTHDDIENAYDLITSYKGSFGYISLNKVKDLIIKNSNERLKILHLVFSKNMKDTYQIPNAQITYDGDPLAIYMMCLHEDDILVRKLSQIGITAKSTASIVESGMDINEPDGWDFIQTSEI